MTEKNLTPNLEVFQHLFNLDKRTVEAIKGDILKRESNKSSFLSRLSIAPWFVYTVSIFERMIAPSMSKSFDPSGDDFVFVSCIDPVHRVKTLPLVANNYKYTLFFLPTVTRPTVVKAYYKHYKENSAEKVYFGTFKRSDVTKYKSFIKQNAASFNQIQCDNENDTRVLREYARRFALYQIYAERVFANSNKDRLWLFEHDKFFFIPVINYFRGKGIMTTQLQHGTFFNPDNTTYFPLYSDKVICCSEREKGLYKETGVKDCDIYIVGAPLQTIGPKKRIDVEEIYDLAVVLTSTAPDELELQKKVLTYIKENLRDKKVLLRFRPRSAAVDKENLSEYTDDFIISEGTTLSEDLCSAKKIITFSLDSIYEIIRNDKIFVTFVDQTDMIGQSLDRICHSVDETETCIEELFEATADSERERYVEVFGETDLEKLRENFKMVINELKKNNKEQ
jgi:hypothetical protein